MEAGARGARPRRGVRRSEAPCTSDWRRRGHRDAMGKQCISARAQRRAQIPGASWFWFWMMIGMFFYVVLQTFCELTWLFGICFKLHLFVASGRQIRKSKIYRVSFGFSAMGYLFDPCLIFPQLPGLRQLLRYASRLQELLSGRLSRGSELPVHIVDQPMRFKKKVSHPEKG